MFISFGPVSLLMYHESVGIPYKNSYYRTNRDFDLNIL